MPLGVGLRVLVIRFVRAFIVIHHERVVVLVLDAAVEGHNHYRLTLHDQLTVACRDLLWVLQLFKLLVMGDGLVFVPKGLIGLVASMQEFLLRETQ